MVPLVSAAWVGVVEVVLYRAEGATVDHGSWPPRTKLVLMAQALMHMPSSGFRTTQSQKGDDIRFKY
jgi:hypothetical protein